MTTTTTSPQPPQATWTHVQFDTSLGTFLVELYYKHAPRSCYNLAALAHTGYYNTNVTFHRIIRDTLIQGGDPTGTGRGGQCIYASQSGSSSKYFDDEITPHLKHTGAGIVSMANSGPNTNGSQFLITLKPTPFLDGKHTIFGRIASGMAVVQRMGLVATKKDDDRPLHPVVIHRATAIQGGLLPTLAIASADAEDDSEEDMDEQ